MYLWYVPCCAFVEVVGSLCLSGCHFKHSPCQLLETIEGSCIGEYKRYWSVVTKAGSTVIWSSWFANSVWNFWSHRQVLLPIQRKESVCPHWPWRCASSFRCPQYSGLQWWHNKGRSCHVTCNPWLFEIFDNTALKGPSSLLFKAYEEQSREALHRERFSSSSTNAWSMVFRKRKHLWRGSGRLQTRFLGPFKVLLRTSSNQMGFRIFEISIHLWWMEAFANIFYILYHLDWGWATIKQCPHVLMLHMGRNRKTRTKDTFGFCSSRRV